MNKRNLTFRIILPNLILLLLLASCATQRNAMPQVAGQDVPKANFTIDFEKRYDIVRAQYQGSNRVYENVKVIGYTGSEVKESSGSLSKGYVHFSHWLVVERMDGRRVYLPMNSITVLEESDRAKK